MRPNPQKEDVLIFCHYADFNPDGSSRLLSPLEDHFRTREILYRKYVLPSRATARSGLNLYSLGTLSFLWSVLWRLSIRHAPKRAPLHNFLAARVGRRLKNVLKRHSPQLVIHTGEFLPLSVASHQLERRSCEILHGRGYEKIDWGYDARERSQLPTDIICFDEKSLRTFSPLFSKGVRIHHAKSHLPVKVDWATHNLNGMQDHPIHILIAGQWGGGFVGPIERSNEILEELSRHISHNTDKCHLNFIPHPVQLNTKKFTADITYIQQIADLYQHTVCPSYALTISPQIRYVCLGFDSGLMTDLEELDIPSVNLDDFWREISSKNGVDCFKYIEDAAKYPNFTTTTDNLPSITALIDSFLLT